MDRARIVLADDHRDFLACTAGLLESEFDVVDIVSDGDSLIAAAERLDPDIVVVDISMPGLSGIEVTRRLKDSGSRAQVVFLTMHQDEDYVREAMATGAQGYVTKNRLALDLMLALREALAGRKFVSNLGIPADSRTKAINSNCN